MFKSHLLSTPMVLLVLLGGCATLPEDRGRGEVSALVAQRTGQVLTTPGPEQATLVAELLQQPLTAQRAVQVALVNNPEIRAEYARLGIAAAEVYNAGRLSNPRFSVSVMSSSESSTPNQVTFGLAQSFTDLLLLSSRSRLAEREFDVAKQAAGAAIIDLAAEVEAAYFEAVGAQQVAVMREKVAGAAQVSAELAQRFFDAGNINALELALEQAAASQVNLDVMRSRARFDAAHTRLNRLMGLRAGDTRWSTQAQLQLPVPREDSLEELMVLARQSRLDLAAKRAQVDLLADSLGVTRSTRYVGDIEVGIETERETDRSRLTGPGLAIELPLFNSGAGKVAQAEAQVEVAEAELQAMALDVGNAVQRAHTQVLAARAIAEQYRSTLMPLRETVVQYTQQELNFMLAGQFELLLAKQQEYDAYQGYLEALRDYWIARTELQRAVGAQLPSAATISGEAIGPPAQPGNTPPATHDMHHSSNTHSSHGGRS